jgi:MFS family permease
MTVATSDNAAAAPWWRQMSGYCWFVLFVATAAWSFDCLGQRIFTLARIPALTALLHGATVGEIQAAGKQVTAIFLVGWGIGGMIFGPLGDRHGRARMLSVTILLYSLCTGLTFFSQTEWDFTLFRFLTGVGVGGVFGLAVSLVAETMPNGARTAALGLLQVLSAVGNILAGLLKLLIDRLEAGHVIGAGTSWRWMFLLGTLPAILVIFIQKYLHEPERWLQLKAQGRLPAAGILTPYRLLLKEARWRKSLVVGSVIASTGVIGLWAIGEYAVDLQKSVFGNYYRQAGVPAAEVGAKVANAITWAYLFSQFGAAAGMAWFTRLAGKWGRRPAFAVGFSAALVSTVLVYWKMNDPRSALGMMFIMSGCQLAVFAGFSIYLPELFPSRLRSTGTSFCYNLGRFGAAIGSFFSAELATRVFGGYGSPLMERYSAMTMCVIFLAGLAILPFAPETRGQPLPEEEPSAIK